MNNEEMRKMWEAAAEPRKPIDIDRGGMGGPKRPADPKEDPYVMGGPKRVPLTPQEEKSKMYNKPEKPITNKHKDNIAKNWASRNKQKP